MRSAAISNTSSSWELARYGFAGVVNTLAGFIVYSAVVLLTPFPFWVATFCALVAGTVCGFVLSRYFVFSNCSETPSAAAPRYLVVIALQYVMSTVSIGLCIYLGMSEIVSYVVCLPAIILLSFLLQKTWVFQATPTQEEQLLYD